MKRIIKYLIITLSMTLPVIASQYGLHTPDSNYTKKFSSEENERILFILDFSNSMTEPIEGSTKMNLMLKTMKEILPKINPNTWVGLRIYGHRMGFTPMEACRASTLVSPILKNNTPYIEQSLTKAKPRGMTPITYSLKQAIKYDFMGFNGKKHIILLTDGGENCDESPCTFVMNLIRVRRDVSIDVIAFNIKDSDDLEQLECTALVTSGKVYNAQTAAELLNGFNNSIESAKNVEAKIVLPK
ncbi:MAG: VWA domain-containing protein [Muribaculaceae bacterium]|nr:VWA domain-containing protein [Muribaculaceae bacterium]